MADEEMRSRERLAEMGERSKSRVDETHDKVVALAAEGLTSIEDTKSRGLSRLAALAHQQQQQQQPPPVQVPNLFHLLCAHACAEERKRDLCRDIS